MNQPMKTTAGILSDGDKCTAAEYLAKAGMDWTVSKRQLGWVNEDNEFIESDNAFGIVRDDIGLTLGTCKKTYKEIQNTEISTPLDAVVMNGDARYVSAGEVRNGALIWLQCKLPYAADIVPGDKMNFYKCLFKGHTGKDAARYVENNVRMSCSNQTFSVMNASQGLSRITHKGNVQFKLEQAQALIRESVEHAKRQVETYRNLAKLQMTTKRIKEYTELMFPAGEGEMPRHIEKKREMLHNFAETSPGTEIPGVRGTGWAWHNALTYYLNYHVGHASNPDARLMANVSGGAKRLAEQSVRVLSLM